MRDLFIKNCAIKQHLFVAFLVVTCLFTFNNSHAQNNPTVKKIVLDAGHGGSDPGNTGTNTYETTEKDITLAVTLKLGKLINEYLSDVEVIYTRADDSYPTLYERSELANREKADLFISIHCDAFTKPTAVGSSTFVMGLHKSKESLRVAMKENSSIYLEKNQDRYEGINDVDKLVIETMKQSVYLDNSLLVSSMVQNQFTERVGRVNRGVKQAGFWVISHNTMPSILIELGFLTNVEEEKFLNSEKGQDYMASAIFRAIRDYKVKIEGIETFNEENKGTVGGRPINEIEKPKEVVDVKPEDTSAAININDELVYEKIKNDVKFQVQIITSSKKLDKSSEEFMGIKKIDEYFSNDIYRYAVGSTQDFKEAKQMQKTLREQGFIGAFVIAVKDGQRINLNDALSQVN